MKIVKTTLLTIALMLICAVSVMAAEPPAYYVGESGNILPTPDTIEQVGTSEPESNPLEFSTTANNNTGNWYWCGGDSDAVTVENINLQTEDNGATVPGTINLVCGPNGDPDVVAMTIQNNSGWTLSEGQTINIYAAANSQTNNTIDNADCFFTLFNINNPTPPAGKSNTSALTINGGELHVYSGAFAPTAIGAAGMSLENGSVIIEEDGSIVSTNNSSNNNVVSTPGLSISGGTLTNSGYLRVIQNLTSTLNGTPGTFNYAAINNTGNSSNLQVTGGTVQCSNSYTAANASIPNGVWIESFNSSGISINNYPFISSTNMVTAFGTATLNTGVYHTLQLTGNNALNIGSTADLTIPDEFELIFGTGTSNSNEGQLNNQGNLNIAATANVTMNKGSVLNNSGTIDVSTAETAQ